MIRTRLQRKTARTVKQEKKAQKITAALENNRLRADLHRALARITELEAQGRSLRQGVCPCHDDAIDDPGEHALWCLWAHDDYDGEAEEHCCPPMEEPILVTTPRRLFGGA